MKKLFLLTLAISLTLSALAQNLTVGSYNIRNANSGDAKQGNGWEQRGPIICNQVEWIDFDIFGAQEVKKGQLDDMLAALPQYKHVGVGRDDGKDGGEHEPIFYKHERFKLLENGDFWISETPDKVGSKGWDAALPRVCSYARFQDKITKERFWFFNLHMDHIGIVARREGAKLIVQKVKEMCKGEPAIVTGDFNVDQKNEIYSILTTSGIMNDCYEVAEKRHAPTGTFNSFDSNLYTDSRIDHIMVSPSIEVTHYAVLTDGYWSEGSDKTKVKGNAAPQEISFQHYIHRCPSDHYPIAARIKLGKRR